MDFTSSFSAKTQAEFYKAEAEMLLFGDRISALPYAEHLRSTLLAIDAVFAVKVTTRIKSIDTDFSPVALIIAYDNADWNQAGIAKLNLNKNKHPLELPSACVGETVDALHYMKALNWVARMATPDFRATPSTIIQLYNLLLKGKSDDQQSGFRKTDTPGRGACPDMIPQELEALCEFTNTDSFSPLGQASVIHHAFERISPYEHLNDITGLLFAFIPMFKRGLFKNGYVVPICWGASVKRDYRDILKNASHEDPSLKNYKICRENWAVMNAHNTYIGATIVNLFLTKVDELNKNWRSRGFKIPKNSALDRLIDLYLAIPWLTIRHAASRIGKSYGATSEAMHQLEKAGIVRQAPLDNRECVYICDESSALISDFVARLEKAADAAEHSKTDEHVDELEQRKAS